MVQIYLMQTEILRDPEMYQRVLENCSAERRERIKKLHREADQIRSLAASALLDYALRKHGLRDKQAEYCYGSAGKPHIPAWNHIHFSLSHSEGMALCAVSDREIGADIQKRRPISSGVQQRFFTEEERKHADIIRLWTLKESYGKLTGEGISVMERTEILLENPVKLLRDGTVEAVGFYEKELENGYYIATCVRDIPSYAVETETVNRSDL